MLLSFEALLFCCVYARVDISDRQLLRAEVAAVYGVYDFSGTSVVDRCSGSSYFMPTCMASCMQRRSCRYQAPALMDASIICRKEIKMKFAFFFFSLSLTSYSFRHAVSRDELDTPCKAVRRIARVYIHLEILHRSVCSVVSTTTLSSATSSSLSFVLFIDETAVCLYVYRSKGKTEKIDVIVSQSLLKR